MELMKKKSDENIELAQRLIDRKLFNASVHCSYYGCFQYIKCILKNNFGLTYQIQNEDRIDSHKFIFDKLSNNIKSHKVMRDIRTDFISLKEKRKTADYYEEEIDLDGSLDAIKEAKSVIFKVKNSVGGLKL